MKLGWVGNSWAKLKVSNSVFKKGKNIKTCEALDTIEEESKIFVPVKK